MSRLFYCLIVIAFLCIPIFSQASRDIQNPKIKWRFKTQGPIRGDAIISAERIYFGSSDGHLYALNKNDGNLLWKSETKGAITGSPSVEESSIYISSRDNFIYSFDASDGKLNWKYEMNPILPDDSPGWEYFSAAPVISGDQLLVGSGDGHLYSLNKNTGELNWNYKTDGRIRATPLVYENKIYQPSNDAYVYVLNLKGELLWKFETLGVNYEEHSFDRSSIYTQPIIVDNQLIIGSRDGNVYSIDLETQKATWNFSYGTTWAMNTTVSEDKVFVGWSTNNIVCALDLTSGEEVWQYKCGAHVYSKPMALDSGVYVGSADGSLYRLNKNTGEKVWEYAIGSEIYSSPIYDSETIYLGSDDGFYYALEEGQEAIKAVYQPEEIKGNAQYLVVDQKLTPFLVEKGFQRLDSAGLCQFINDRIQDKKPSVVVFALLIMPKNIIGDEPEKGLARKYLESGGKVVWMGDVPNFYELDESGQFKRDPEKGIRLLGIDFTTPTESGNYYSKATQTGLNWGVPEWITTTNCTAPEKEVIALAFDEYDRASIWMKKFNDRPGSGFVSCRTWSWNIPIKEEDLELIHQLAVHELE